MAKSVASMKVAIVGGSLGGLAAANVFHRLGASVTVFEKSPSGFENRGACLGFVDVKLWESIRGARMSWMGKQSRQAPEGSHSFSNQGSFYYGDMWNFLYTGLPEETVKFGRTVETFGSDVERPTIDGEVYDLAIIADGGFSTLRGKYFDGERLPDYTGYQIFWARCDAAEVPGLTIFDGSTVSSGIFDSVNLPVPTFDGRSMYMAALFVATPQSEVSLPEWGDNTQIRQTKDPHTPDWLLPFVKHHFAHRAGGQVARFYEAAATKGKITPSPVFEYAASKTVNGRVVLMGDAAHLASPWTAAGAHTAVLDAKGLLSVFSLPEAVDVCRALKSYDKGGIQRAADLLRHSKAVSRHLLPREGKRAVTSPAATLPGYLPATAAA